jgi:hypothetical protein
MHKLCNYIKDELMDLEMKVGRGEKLSAGEVEYGDKLAHFKKCLLTVEAMEDGYSKDNWNRGRSFEGRSNDWNYSEARNRDSMGRYSRDGFMDQLMSMRESAPNEKSRRAIEKMINELEN